MRTFWLILYYAFAKHLPKSTMPIIGKIALRLRYQCAKHLFARCDGFVNLEQGAYIGNGKNFYVGKNVGIGKDFVCHSRIVTIQDGLLMGENVLFQGGGTFIRKPRHAYRFRTRRRTYPFRDMWRRLDRRTRNHFAWL